MNINNLSKLKQNNISYINNNLSNTNFLKKLKNISKMLYNDNEPFDNIYTISLLSFFFDDNIKKIYN